MRRFSVQWTNAAVPKDGDVFVVNENLFTGESDLTKVFGQLTSLETDLLLLAATIFAADRATARGDREEICRHIEITVPIVNLDRLLPLIPLIEKVLYRLSNDAWTINLKGEGGQPEEWSGTSADLGKTLLFSGGLDSLAAALEFGKDAEKICLVSHRTRNTVTNRAQDLLVGLLKGCGYDLPHIPVFVSSRSGGPTELDHDEENSQRTRSFLFLVLGAIVARRYGHRQVVMLAENGQLAINLSLTPGRVGALSTHTAHPSVLALMESFLCQAMGVEITIHNPYVHLTKREVVAKVYHTLPEAVPVANSCWRNSRLLNDATHCGECIPCFVRRIAIESFTPDSTAYERDPWTEEFSRLPPNDIARRNLSDLAEFASIFQTATNEEIMSEWPELYGTEIDTPEVISMYRRFAQDLREVFGRYPSLAPLVI